jgi:beta-N-acetylhexosaminidase
MPATPTRRPASRAARWTAAAGAVLLAASLAPAVTPAVAADRPQSQSQSPDQARAERWVQSRVARMSLREKVGQLFMTQAYGQTADTQDPAAVAANQEAYGVDNAAQLIDRYKLGGIIYFVWSDNVANPEQIAGLSNGIQDAALDQRLPIPSLVATDQEGGIVARIGPPATEWPGNMALGAGRSDADARRAAAISGTELDAMGVNWDFAPVADVNVNPQNPVIGVRSFSEDPALAARLTAAQVRGYQGAGIAAASKHFPGHGDTATDSHTGLPVIDHTRAEWRQIDRPPFQAAIDAGIKAIMSAHIVVPSLDPSGDPATLSRPIMTGILREQMGYDGVVITDALGMQGVRDKYGDDRVPVLALKAGVDMLLMPPDFDLAYNAVLEAVRSGEISERRINRSVFRILRLKWQLGLFRNPYVDESAVSETVGTPEHLAAAQRITDRTPTLLKNDSGLLPLQPGSGQSALVTGWGVSTTQTIADGMADRGVAADVFETGTNPTAAQIEAAVAQAQSRDLTVVTTNGAWRTGSEGQRELVNQLVASGKPVIAVAARDPYDIAYYPDVPAYLTTYSYTGVSMQSLVRVLFGEVSPTGRLPVTVPSADDPATPLYPFGAGLSY